MWDNNHSCIITLAFLILYHDFFSLFITHAYHFCTTISPAMTICTMVCALLGLTSPSNRGGLLTTLLMLYVFMGSAAGFAAARIYKLFGGKQWKQNTVMTATLYPAAMGSIYLCINSFVAFEGSSTAGNPPWSYPIHSPDHNFYDPYTIYLSNHCV